MKRPQPDIGDQLRAQFISVLRNLRQLKKHWGTETQGGTEVMKSHHYYYPADKRGSNFEDLFRFLGAYDNVVDIRMKGVKRAWIFFNKNKKRGALNVATDVYIADNLNLMWWNYNDGPRPSNLTLTTVIDIEAKQQSSTSSSIVPDVAVTPLLDPSWTTAQLITAIKDNYETLWDTCHISQQGVGVINKGSFTDPITEVVTPDNDDLTPNDPWLQTIARYALRTSGVPCTIKDVQIGYGQAENGRLYPTYAVTLEIPFVLFDAGDPIVNIITNDVEGTYTSKTRTKLSYPNAYYTQQAITSMNSDVEEDDETLLSRPYEYWEEAGTTSYDILWERVGGMTFTRTGWDGSTKTYTFGGRWYLKADIFSNPKAYGMTFREVNNYVLSIVDTAYKKEKASFLQKVIAVVLFIIVVIITWGKGTWAAIALLKGILYGAMVLTIMQMVAGFVGATDWAMAFAAANKTVEPFTIIATILLIWTGISNAIAAAKEAAAKSAGKAAADLTLREVVTHMAEELVGKVIEKVVTKTTELLAFTPTAMMRMLTGVIKIVNVLQGMKLEEINERNKDLQAEYEKLTEESAMETDVLQGFARVYASPATADWSMFSSLYDLPYERSGGSLHIGNVQRTTKQALRKAKYDDPAFANILVI